MCSLAVSYLYTSGNSGLCTSCLVSVFKQLCTIICDYSFIFLFILLHRLLDSSVRHTALASSAQRCFTITKVCVKFQRWKYTPRVTISMQEIVGGVVKHCDLVVRIKIAKYFFLACLLVIRKNVCSQKFSRYTVSNKIIRMYINHRRNYQDVHKPQKKLSGCT